MARLTTEQWEQARAEYEVRGVARTVLRGYAWHVSRLYEIIPTPVRGLLRIFEVDVPLVHLPDGYDDHATYLYELAKK